MAIHHPARKRPKVSERGTGKLGALCRHPAISFDKPETKEPATGICELASFTQVLDNR